MGVRSKLSESYFHILAYMSCSRPLIDLTLAMGMQVHMLADSHGNLARALGVELDMEKMLGTKRCKR